MASYCGKSGKSGSLQVSATRLARLTQTSALRSARLRRAAARVAAVGWAAWDILLSAIRCQACEAQAQRQFKGSCSNCFEEEAADVVAIVCMVRTLLLPMMLTKSREATLAFEGAEEQAIKRTYSG